VLVAFDATVLCGALRKPTGYNFKLLELAADGTLLQGFTTDIAGMEFVRNALDGLGGVSYDMELIEAFLDHFSPLFNPENVEPSPIGRALPGAGFPAQPTDRRDRLRADRTHTRGPARRFAPATETARGRVRRLRRPPRRCRGCSRRQRDLQRQPRSHA
jgi:hypothetical protein